MKVSDWPRRNILWLALMALAPLAGGLTSYFVLAWWASGGAEKVPVVGRAVAQPSSPKGRLTIEEAQALTDRPIFWAGPEVAGHKLTAIVRQAYTPPPEIGAPHVDQVNIGYGDCPGTCALPITITSQRYCAAPPELAGRSVLPERPFEVRGATAYWVAGGRDTLVLFTGQSSITIIATGGESVALEVARRLVAMNRPSLPRPPQPTREPSVTSFGEALEGGAPPAGGFPAGAPQPQVAPTPVAVPTPVPWGPASADEPLGPPAVSCP